MDNSLKKIGWVFFVVLFALTAHSLKAEAGTWSSAGGPEGALVKQLVVSPDYATDQTILAVTGLPGSGRGSLFKTTDGGTSWFPLTTGTAGIETIAISTDYATDQTIFAGYSTGVLKSTDGGATWNTIKSNAYITSITLSPNYPVDQTIFIATASEILKSVDGGSSWLNVTPSGVCTGCGIGSSSIAISPNYAIDRIVYATISAPSYMAGLYKSTDGGNSWSRLTGSSAVFLSPGFVTDQTLFGISSSVVNKSTDGGISWSAVGTGLPNGNIKSVAISPNYSSDNTLFVGMNAKHSDWNTVQGPGIFKSTDGGASWTAVNTGLTNLEVNSVAISPNYTVDQTLFAGTFDSAGLFKSTDGGASWSLSNKGLAGLLINSVALSPNYPIDHTVFGLSFPFSGTYYGSLSSPGSFFKSMDGGTTWTAAISGMTLSYGVSNYTIASVSVSPAYSADQTLFSAIYGKSTDGGTTWTPIHITAQNVLLSFAFSPQFSVDHTIFAINAHNGLCFYCNSGGVLFKSTNGGVGWGSVMVMPNNPLAGYTVVLSPNFQVDQTVLVGDQYRGFFKSTNGGTTWYQVNIETGLISLVSPTSGIFSSLGITVLAVSPNYSNDQTIFAGTSKGVFKSANGGVAWTPINAGLISPSGSSTYGIESIVTSPNFTNDQTIFAGTSGGVFKSTDGGTTWDAINSGLAISNVRSLAISPGYPCDGTLFAGTEASVWKFTDTEAMATCNNGNVCPITRNLSMILRHLPFEFSVLFRCSRAPASAC